MLLHSLRVSIRPWNRQDDYIVDRWPAYNDPFESLWNLPRSFSWSTDALFTTDNSFLRRSWAIENAVGEMIGRISLREIDAKRVQSRLGITLGAPYVSQGLGTAALRLFLDYYFADLGFEAMVLDVAAPNERAVRCYERLGFQHVGEDWRGSGFGFDPRIIDEPQYANLRRYFRSGQRGLQVQFFEMRLERDAWLVRRTQFG